MAIRVGFTGTQEASYCTPQRMMLLHKELLKLGEISEAHHGDCIGADACFHAMIAMMYASRIIHVHPPLNQSKRAFCTPWGFMHPQKPYLVRNRDIVDSCDVLIAFPKDPMVEEQRSGTWSTWRYAKRMKKRWVLV